MGPVKECQADEARTRKKVDQQKTGGAQAPPSARSCGLDDHQERGGGGALPEGGQNR